MEGGGRNRSSARGGTERKMEKEILTQQTTEHL